MLQTGGLRLYFLAKVGTKVQDSCLQKKEKQNLVTGDEKGGQRQCAAGTFKSNQRKKTQ